MVQKYPELLLGDRFREISVSYAIDKGGKFHFHLRANQKPIFAGMNEQFRNYKMVNDEKLNYFDTQTKSSSV